MMVKGEMVFSLFLALILAVSGRDSSEEICDEPDNEAESIKSGANDVIVVQQDNGELMSTQFVMMVGKFANWRTMFRSRQGRQVTITINGNESPVRMTIGDSGEACFSRRVNRRNFTNAELQHFNLQRGINQGVYKVPSLKVEVRFLVYLLSQDDRLVLSDVDGTITEEDVKGRVFPAFGFKANHDGVVKLFDNVVRNGYVMVYLTARSMGEDGELREYLFETLDDTDGGYSLPLGPVLMSPKTMAEAAIENFVTGPEFQKAATLKEVFALFNVGSDVAAGAYGNKDSDLRAYSAAGVAADRVFIVDTDGRLKSAEDGRVSSYPVHGDRVQQMYPHTGQ